MKTPTRQFALAACSFISGVLVCFVWLHSHRSPAMSSHPTTFSLSSADGASASRAADALATMYRAGIFKPNQ